ncbi:uncharacterized protein LOC126056174 [Helicoverpa armigera]|uniref:uncharacterized protein LOC126056174 n=1 Tax=Helicoverpa armigera TaxID=29058 RepID=UPI003082F321
MPKTLNQRKDMYNDCANKYDPGPEKYVSEGIMKEIEQDFRVLPTFEKGLYERCRMKHLSLLHNEKLSCCWQKYKDCLETKKYEPYCFPKITDLHYYRYAVEFMPSENHWQFDTKLKLSPGPGVDAFGQKPIPQELMMRRSGGAKCTKDTAVKGKKNTAKPKKKSVGTSM